MKLIAVILVIGALAGGVWFAVRQGFSTRTAPTAAEAFVATHMREWSLPAKYAALKNPVACSVSALGDAKAHWADHCATCHANSGAGDTMLGKTMYPRPPDMRGKVTQGQPDGALYYTIKNGVRLTGMPAFGEPGDNDADSWKLICLIRHLPQLSSDEIAEMKKMNPKTPDDLAEEKQEADFLSGAAASSSTTPEEHHHHH